MHRLDLLSIQVFSGFYLIFKFHYKLLQGFLILFFSSLRIRFKGSSLKNLWRWEDNLKVGGLYVHLGSSFPGMQRVLSMETEELPVKEEERNHW